jgi:hypothetical protein
LTTLEIDDLSGELVLQSVNILKLRWDMVLFGGFLGLDEDGSLGSDLLEGRKMGLDHSDFQAVESKDGQGLEALGSVSTSNIDGDNLSLVQGASVVQLDGGVSKGEGSQVRALGGVDGLNGDHVAVSLLADSLDEVCVAHNFLSDESGGTLVEFLAALGLARALAGFSGAALG